MCPVYHVHAGEVSVTCLQVTKVIIRNFYKAVTPPMSVEMMLVKLIHQENVIGEGEDSSNEATTVVSNSTVSVTSPGEDTVKCRKEDCCISGDQRWKGDLNNCILLQKVITKDNITSQDLENCTVCTLIMSSLMLLP